ncbi:MULTISPECIES: aminoglycoside N(3)-acetyltransferase [Bacillales]|uniref:aminoglycoside N(3)-acetyltransferase n=1 Tax=Bacillales TaxID=1385 RepID=UPI0006A77B49|nr:MULTISPECIES: AAC(3) family N-acetyltransferase [Bacillales]OBZ07808.1 AAC(3) family N-acetyltransferase [Bacillus sp. FJAT-26390]
MEEIQGDLLTVETLKSDFAKLGVTSEMSLMMHSSMKALGGYVNGGPVAVILAIEELLGSSGTLVMPTHTGDLSDPTNWRYPPVRESWWEPIKQSMPAFEADLTPCRGMGAINECFRKQNGVMRSNHPQVSFAAWGSKKDSMTANHSLAYSLSEQSPLARLYEANGWVLLLGVTHNRNTSLHLAEYRANYKGKTEIISKAPVLADGEKQWVDFQDIDFDSDDFDQIGEAFERETGYVRRGKVGNADALLMPMKELVDFGVKWMEENRGR